MNGCTLLREMELPTHNAKREYRRIPRVAAITRLKDKGFQVRAISPYMLRVNERLDYFPVNDKYHDLVTDVWGQVRLSKPGNITADQWWYGGQQQFFICWFFSCTACLQKRPHRCRRTPVPAALHESEVTV